MTAAVIEIGRALAGCTCDPDARRQHDGDLVHVHVLHDADCPALTARSAIFLRPEGGHR